MRANPQLSQGARGLANPLVANWLPCFAGLSLLVGVALRAVQLGDRALTFDEGYTWALAQRSFADMVELFTFEANGTLYPVLLWPLLRLGDSEAAIRSLALAFGIAAIPATFFAARTMLRDVRAALFAVVLISASPLAIGFSQEAKGHALAMALVPASYGLLVLALRGRADLWWVLYGTSVVLVAYASTTALIALAGQPIMVVQGRRQIRRWLATIGVSAMALVPLAYLLVRSANERNALYWESRPDAREVASTIVQLALGEASRTRLGRAAFLVLLGFLILLVAVVRRQLPVSMRGFLASPTFPLIAWCLAPLIVLIVISMVKPIFDVRYVGPLLPAACILGGSLLARAPSRLAAGVSASVVVALAVAFAAADYKTTDYRLAGKWFSARTDGDDSVLVVPVEQLPALAYYAPSLQDQSGRVAVEEWGDRLPAHVVGYKLPGGYGDAPTAPPPIQEIERLTRRGAFFTLVYPGALGDHDEDWLRARCEVDTAPIESLEVERYRCQSPPGTG